LNYLDEVLVQKEEIIKAQGYIRRDDGEQAAVPVVLNTAAQVNIVDEKYALKNSFKELYNY
jgi:hypothetical protein